MLALEPHNFHKVFRTHVCITSNYSWVFGRSRLFDHYFQQSFTPRVQPSECQNRQRQPAYLHAHSPMLGQFFLRCWNRLNCSFFFVKNCSQANVDSNKNSTPCVLAIFTACILIVDSCCVSCKSPSLRFDSSLNCSSISSFVILWSISKENIKGAFVPSYVLFCAPCRPIQQNTPCHFCFLLHFVSALTFFLLRPFWDTSPQPLPFNLHLLRIHLKIFQLIALLPPLNLPCIIYSSFSSSPFSPTSLPSSFFRHTTFLAAVS